jgi:hypothetical protein
MAFLTIEDLRDPSRASGFRYVTYRAHRAATKPFQAQHGPKRHLGPRRATAEEAAQDYCDHVNGRQIPTPRLLRSAGHKRPKRRTLPRDPEVEAALGVLRDARAQREGEQGYVYCIGERDRLYAVKIGYSVNPPKRVPELQTGNPRTLVLLGYFPGTEDDEKAMHAKYAEDNILQEWFRPSPALLSEFDNKEVKAAA